MCPDYLSVADVLGIDRAVIQRYGGAPGIRDQSLLESAVAQAQQSAFQADLYPTIPEKAAAYAFFLSENQPFFDGNKRVAAVAMLTFLQLNGFDFQAGEDELYRAMMSLANKSWTRQQFFAWVVQHAVPPALSSGSS